MVKLLDLAQDWQTLSQNPNPFATVVMAHLKANQTRKDRQERLQWKLTLTRQLYRRGYQRQDVINLLQFIDWVMSLPKQLDQQFWQEVFEFQEEQRMPYVMSIERIGIEKGLQKGLEQGLQQGLQQGEAKIILRQLKRSLGQIAESVDEQIRKLSTEQLEALADTLFDFENEADLLNWLENQPKPDSE